MGEENILLQEEPIIYAGAGAVNSVNGYTGDVILTTSDLENTSDYQTGSEVESAISSAIAGLDVPTKTSELVNDGADGTSTYVEADELATVATSGSYDDLLNKPTIPAAQVNSDWNAVSGVAQILNKPTLSTVATSGDYNDLLNKPTIPAAQVQSDWSQNDSVAVDYIKNKPTIPTVNDATLTITQNGTSAGTFTANDADDTTIALTDTTYSDFIGTDGVSAGTAGLVPAPATTDAGKFLKADGTWDTAGGGGGPTVVQTTGTSTTDVMSQNATTVALNNISISGSGAPTTSTVGTVGQLYQDTTNGKLYICTDTTGGTYTWTEVGAGGGGGVTVVQTPGTSQTDVMSQNATTSMIFADPETQYKIKIGAGASSSEGNNAVEIGHNAAATATNSIALGYGATTSFSNAIAIGRSASSQGITGICIGQSAVASANNATAIGPYANAAGSYSVSLGYGSTSSAQGEVGIGLAQAYNNYGYNNSQYRLLTGLYDGQSAHDAVNLGQLNSRVLPGGTSAPTTSTVGTVGALMATVESGTGHLYICTDDTGGTYTWQTLV